MTKERLRAYRHNLAIYNHLCSAPTTDIVTGSGDFPYTPRRVTVSAGELPQKEALRRELASVEAYVDGIGDTVTRNIFQWIYIDGMTQEEVGEILHYSQSMISRVIDSQLEKDS